MRAGLRTLRPGAALLLDSPEGGGVDKPETARQISGRQALEICPVLPFADTGWQVPFLNQPFKGPCPKFDWVLNHMMISPLGSAYVCCADFMQSSSLGNLFRQSIAEIWGGPIRKEFIRSLFELRFERTFAVCRTCSIGYGPLLNERYYLMQKRIRGFFAEGKLAYRNQELVICDKDLASRAAAFSETQPNYAVPVVGRPGPGL